MRIRLDSRWSDLLLRLPESGMGYQRVDIRFRDGRRLEDVPVFNAEEVDLPEELAQAEIADLQPRK
jgi:hypothetical protein